MRSINLRMIIAGILLIILGVGFYAVMLSAAPNSTDPTALMQTVGSVSGVAMGISLVLIVIGLIGKKV